MAKSRRKAREAALRALYEIDIASAFVEDAVEHMIEHADMEQSLVDFAVGLVNGVYDKHEAIDAQLGALLHDYDYERLAAVDRNLMRLAAFELFHEPGIPPAVTINEAVELAKKYSTAESGKFVNGVLGKLLADSPKANWDPSMADTPADLEEVVVDDVPEIDVEQIKEDTPAAAEFAKIGKWTIRREAPDE